MYWLCSRVVRPYPCSPQDMWNGGQPVHDHLYLTSHATPPWGWLSCLYILQNLGPQLCWSVAWMEGIHLYVSHPRLVRPFPYTHKTCEKGDNPSITTCTSYHIPHLPGDGLVVCGSCKILAHNVGGMLPGWRISTCMCCIIDMWDLSHASTKHVNYMATHPWLLVPHNLHHNPHFHVDRLVVLQILSGLCPHLGRSVVWIEGIYVHGLHPRLGRPSPCIHKTCEMYANPSMTTDPHITTHISLEMAW